MWRKDRNSKIFKALGSISMVLVTIYVITSFNLLPNSSGQNDPDNVDISQLAPIEEEVEVDEDEDLADQPEEIDEDPEEIEEDPIVKDPTKGMYGVTSSNMITSEIGMSVLSQGGNAVDAAVAMAYSLGVVDPQNSGIGGSGGILVYDAATGESVFYDYYFAAGSDENNRFEVAIPGFVKGMEKVNQDLGVMDMESLIQYSVDLAEEGISATEAYARNLNNNSYIREVHPSYRGLGTISQGSQLKYPELAETMRKIQAQGSDAFYSRDSEIAQNFMDLSGTDPETLESYEVIVKEPIISNYRGYDIISPPPPFSGLALAQNLALDEIFDFPDVDYSNEDYWDTFIRRDSIITDQRKSLIHDEYSLDEDFSRFLEEDYLRQVWEDFGGINEDVDPEQENTTAFSVIDKEGLLVSATNTISNYWGSYQIRDGIIYNNAMKNFTDDENNELKRLRRPRTGISQAIIVNDDYLETIGSSGGAEIPNYTYELLVANKKRNIEIQEANELKRRKVLSGIVFLEGARGDYNLGEFRLNEPVDFWPSNTGFWGRAAGIVIDGDKISGHTDARDYYVPGFIYFDGEKVGSGTGIE